MKMYDCELNHKYYSVKFDLNDVKLVIITID